MQCVAFRLKMIAQFPSRMRVVDSREHSRCFNAYRRPTSFCRWVLLTAVLSIPSFRLSRLPLLRYLVRLLSGILWFSLAIVMVSIACNDGRYSPTRFSKPILCLLLTLMNHLLLRSALNSCRAEFNCCKLLHLHHPSRHKTYRLIT